MEFTCTANNSEDISYRINGLSTSSPEIINTGLYEQQPGFDLVGDMTLRRNLSVTVSSLYNNTEILCTALKGIMGTSSNTATLTVQGKAHAHRGGCRLKDSGWHQKKGGLGGGPQNYFLKLTL